MPKNEELQTQIDDLQTRLSHQEDMLDTLNTIVTEQDALIRGMQLQMQQSQKKLDDALFAQSNTVEQKPPHYWVLNFAQHLHQPLNRRPYIL